MASVVSADVPSFMRICSAKFTFHIDYFKSMNVPIGKCICSPTFNVGGYDCFIVYVPRGTELENLGSPRFIFLCVKWRNTHSISKDELEHTFGGPNKCSDYDNFITRDEIEHRYCKEGILAISCNIRVLTESKGIEKYFGGLCEHMEKLWKKRESFDVTFEVKGESIPAHKFMLAAKSPVFEAKLFGSMAEAKMGCITIDEMKAETFKALLHFLYTDKLSIDESNDDGTPPVRQLRQLFTAADRYDITKLSLMCVEQLEKEFSVDMVATTLLLADHRRYSHAGMELKNKCLKFVSDLDNFPLVAQTLPEGALYASPWD